VPVKRPPHVGRESPNASVDARALQVSRRGTHRTWNPGHRCIVFSSSSKSGSETNCPGARRVSNSRSPTGVGTGGHRLTTRLCCPRPRGMPEQARLGPGSSHGMEPNSLRHRRKTGYLACVEVAAPRVSTAPPGFRRENGWAMLCPQPGNSQIQRQVDFSLPPSGDST
jgi:hypothetical protein